MNVNLYPLHSFLQIENAPVRIGKLTNYRSTSINRKKSMKSAGNTLILELVNKKIGSNYISK